MTALKQMFLTGLVLASAVTASEAQQAIQRGDQVVVVRNGVGLQRGYVMVAPVRRGQLLQVLKVQGEWIGTSAESEGRTVGGWVLARDVIKVLPAVGELPPPPDGTPKKSGPRFEPRPKKEPKGKAEPPAKPKAEPKAKPQPPPTPEPEPKEKSADPSPDSPPKKKSPPAKPAES